MASPYGGYLGGGTTNPYEAAASSQRRLYSAFASLTPVQQQQYIAGIQGTTFQPPPQESNEGFFGKLVPNIVETAASQVADSLIHALPGAAEAAQAVWHDFSPVMWGVNAARGKDWAPTHSAGLLKEMGAGMKYDVTHPTERPGYLLLDALAVGSLGAGAVGKAGQIGRAGMEAARVGRTARLDEGFGGGTPTLQPRPRPVGPQPGDPDFAAAPSRTISDIAQVPVTHPLENPPLARGYHYTVHGPKGKSFVGYFDRTVQKRTAGGTYDYHRFLTPEGKTKEIRDASMERLTISPGQVAKDFPGESVSMYDLPPAPWPPELAKAKPVKAPAVAPVGEERVAGQFAPKVEEAKPPPEVAQAEAELERAVAQPGPSLAETVKREPIKPKLDPRTKQPVWPIAEGERVFVEEVPGGNGYIVSHTKGGEVVGETKRFAAGAQADAWKYGHRLANAVAKTIKGGEVPSAGAVTGNVLRAMGRAAVTRREPGTRTIEHFIPEEPRFTVGKTPVEEVTDAAGRPYPMQRSTKGYQVQPVSPYKPKEKGEMPWPHKSLTAEAKKLEQQGEQQLFPELERTPDNQVARLLPREGWLGRQPAERTIDTGRIVKTEVNLSRNPGVALATNIWIDIMEAHPTLRLGPWGRNMERYVKFNKKEHDRAMGALQAAREAGLTKETDALDRAVKSGNPNQIKAILDSMNIMAKIWLLYLKPGYYVANLIGQGLLTASDHAWSPRSVANTVRIQRQMFGDRKLAGIRAYAIKKGMGETMGVALQDSAHGLGIGAKIRGALPDYGITFRGSKKEFRNIGSYKNLASGANKLLDTPFRDNAFIHEAQRHGYKDADQIGKLIDDAIAGDEAATAKFVEISRRANQNIIDYARMGKLEKEWIRRIIFFYPWFKGASVYAGHFVATHPMQAFIAANLGEYGTKKEKELFGALPSFLEGVIPVGETHVKGVNQAEKIINPSAVTVLGTPGQVLNTATASITGGGRPADQISQYLTPGISAGIAAVTHKDPFTGAEYPAKLGPLDIIVDQVAQAAALPKMVQQEQRASDIASGKLDPSQILFPYSPGQPFNRFALSVAPYNLNVGEARSRAFAEQTSLASRREREFLKNKDYRDRYLEAGQKTGTFQQLPPELASAFQQRALLASETAAAEAALDRPMTMVDRLEAVVGLLVRQGKMEAEQARQILEHMVTLPDSQIESYKSKLTNAYFGGEVISRYRAAMNAQGAGLTVP